ncbi:MAG: phosphoribosylanthranilate isomerase [Granulosicoccus sp.]
MKGFSGFNNNPNSIFVFVQFRHQNTHDLQSKADIRLDSSLAHLLLLRAMKASRTRVKICGITRLEDAIAAENLGVDALGFVFVPASKRYISPVAASEIAKQLTPFVTVVGLFLNAEPATVKKTLSLLPHMVPQFHGQETGDYCDSFNRSYLKALGVGSRIPTRDELHSFRGASGFLFDSNEPGALGGTGHAFDWTRLEDEMEKPLILAGGLNAHNVACAIDQVSPHALDVSSGVEVAKGIKDRYAMQEFMRAVEDADAIKNQQEIA